MFFQNIFGKILRPFLITYPKTELHKDKDKKATPITQKAITSFYAESNDNAFRFGDVLKGYIFTSPKFKNPEDLSQFKIEVNRPAFCVVLSPCCSIGEGTILLAPLRLIKTQFFENPYFEEDLTRINRKMKPEQSVSPEVWNKFPDEVKQNRLNEGITYACNDFFIYTNHELLPEYPLRIKGKSSEQITGYYMIDFRDTHKINCDEIINASKSPLSTKYYN